MANATARKKTNNIIDEGIERVQQAFDSANGEIEKFQKQARKTTKQLTTRYQKSAKKAQTRLFNVPAVKKAEKVSKDLRKRAENNVDDFMKLLPIASDSDVKKINRKLAQISRKLKELENAQA